MRSNHRGAGRRRRMLAAFATTVLAAALLVAACGGDEESAAPEPATTAAAPAEDTSAAATETSEDAAETTEAADTGAEAAAGECGSVPEVAPNDPNGLLAQLPESLQAEYLGYPALIQESVWTDWVPQGDPPYTVGLSFDALLNPYQTVLFDTLQSLLKESSLVGEVIALASPEGGAANAQLQQYQSLVQQGADIIILQAGSSATFQPAVEEAGAAGIPTIALINAIDSQYAVNVTPNPYLSTAAPLAELLTILGGEGTLLGVHGIPSAQIDKDTWTSFATVLELCPGVEVVDEIDGNFAPPQVKSAVLQYLSTHPEDVDGVLQTAVMAQAIIDAYEQAGRDVPPVLDIVASRGSLAYWRDHAADGYQTAGMAGAPVGLAELVARVTERMLAGQGVKITSIVFPQPVITQDNLSDYVQSDWTFDTAGDVEAPEDVKLSDEELDTLFTNPEAGTGS